jgi:hypothetical protein
MALKRILATIAVAAAIPAAASASVTISGISGNPGFETGRVVYTPGGIGGVGGPASQYLNIGRIHLTGIDNNTLAAVSFDSYCIDIFHYLQGGSFDLQAFAMSDPVKQSQLKTLLTHTAGYIDAATNPAQAMDTSAAIQMAVWEIVNESGTSGYSLGTGLFQVASNWGTVVPNARGLAQSYLNAMGGWSADNNYRVRMMTAFNPVGNQRQVFLAAVPEPSAWALMILGFGLVGSAMRRNAHRRSTTIAFD